MIGEEEHSWREIALGGDATVKVALRGNLFSASPAGLEWLQKLSQLLDEATVDTPEVE